MILLSYSLSWQGESMESEKRLQIIQPLIPQDLLPHEQDLLRRLPIVDRLKGATELRRREAISSWILPEQSLPPFIEADHGLTSFDDALQKNREARQREGRKDWKVLLIVPPDLKNLPTGNTGAWPPLALWRAGSWAQQKGAEARLLDGTIMTQEEIEQVISEQKPDLVGLSVLPASIEAAMELSRMAKDVGSIVCWGNDYASQHAVDTTKRDENVDVVLGGEGADRWFGDLTEVVMGKQGITDVPGASWRTERGIRNNPYKGYDMNENIPLSSNLISKEQYAIYAGNFNRGNWGDSFQVEIVPAIINIASGCHWGASRCDYCTIPNLAVRYKTNIESIWQNDIGIPVREFGANLVYDGGADNMTSLARPPAEIFKGLGIPKDEPPFLARLLAARPKEFEHVMWISNGRSDDLIRPGVAKLLKDLGFVRLQMGIDHFNDEILRTGVHKGNPHGGQTNREAMLTLRDYNIQGYLSHVIGARGETPDTLEEFKDGIRFEIKTLGPDLCSTIGVSPLIPLPGGLEYKRLVAQHSEFREKYGPQVDPRTLDIREMTMDAIRFNAPSVSWEQIVDTHNQVYKMCYDSGIRTASFTIPGEKDAQGRMWLK